MRKKAPPPRQRNCPSWLGGGVEVGCGAQGEPRALKTWRVYIFTVGKDGGRKSGAGREELHSTPVLVRQPCPLAPEALGGGRGSRRPGVVRGNVEGPTHGVDSRGPPRGMGSGRGGGEAAGACSSPTPVAPSPGPGWGYARPISSSTLRGDSSSSCSRSACSIAFSTLFFEVSWTSPPIRNSSKMK